MLKIAFITNHPPPFRIPIYKRVGRMPEVDLQLIFCSEREPNRQWELPPLDFKHTFLKERFVRRGDNFIHNNPDVVTTLKQLQPDAIITTGFNPTFLYAFGYAVAKGIPHIPMTDGTDISEQALSGWHRTVRRLVYARSQAFIYASHGGLRLYESYGISKAHCFQSCLCIDNDLYKRERNSNQIQFDFIFCGRIVPAKNPLFALEVAADTARKLGRKTSIIFVGYGEQEDAIKNEATRLSDLIDVHLSGHASQEHLPTLYRSARLFLFPTSHDAWGVVANEACAAGLPIIVSPHAGVAGELVVDGENGFVAPLDVKLWSERAALILTQDAVHRRFSRYGHALINQYTFDHAAAGIVNACLHAVSSRSGARKPDVHARKVG